MRQRFFFAFQMCIRDRNPSDVVRDYGADTLRLYEMFMGPLEVSKPWSTTGVVGAKKFINRVWNFFTEPANITEDNDGKLTKIYHQTVKKVTSDFESLCLLYTSRCV